MDPWKEIARKEQQNLSEIFGSTDWDVYRRQERKLLYDKVGLVIFGPTCVDYEEWQLTRIRKVTEAIVREDEHDGPDGTFMSIVALVVKPQEGVYYCHPVFRVPKCSGGSRKHTFVDCLGRVYGSWQDFMENNKLPPCEICFPVDGVYRKDVNGKVVLGFVRREPSVWSAVGDGASNLIALGSLGVALTALATPVAAPLMTAAAVGTALSGVYGAARSAQDLVDRNTHGQSIGVDEAQSLRDWATILSCVMGVHSSVEVFKLYGSCTTTVKVGVAIRAANGFRKVGTPPEMFRDVRGKRMLQRDVSCYVLLFGHVAADAVYVVKFLNSDQKNNVLLLKSILLTTNHRGETLRYLEFVGFAGGKLPDILSRGIFDRSCKFQLSFDCNEETFHKIEDEVSGCIDRNLSACDVGKGASGMKAIIDYFSEHDLSWVFELSRKILSVTDYRKGEALLDVMAGLYFFLKNVVKMARSETDVSFRDLNLTSHDFVQVVKICIAKDDNFSVKFRKLYEGFLLPMLPDLILTGSAYLLQKCIHPPGTKNLNSATYKEIFEAVGELVGVPLDSSNAKITYAEREIFVVITEKTVDVSVVKVVQEEKYGVIVASVLR